MLEAEKIQKNWESLIKYIEKYIKEPRKKQLIDFYEKNNNRLILMPFSPMRNRNNSFCGGYVDHVIRAIDISLKLNEIWKSLIKVNYTEEELIFSVMNCNLGKMGDEINNLYIPQKDQWKKEKLKEIYTYNDKIQFMSIPDRSIYLLMNEHINITENEYLSIKLHFGLYDKANEQYFKYVIPENAIRAFLIYIVHQADFMASTAEFEKDIIPRFQQNLPENNKVEPVEKVKSNLTIKEKALKEIQDVNLKNVFDTFFK